MKWSSLAEQLGTRNQARCTIFERNSHRNGCHEGVPFLDKMIKEIALVQLQQYRFTGASTGSHMPTGLVVSFVYPSFWETKVQLTSQRLSVHTKGCNHLNWIEFPLSMSMMSPVIFRPWLEVPLGFEPRPPAHQSGAQLRRLNSVWYITAEYYQPWTENTAGKDKRKMRLERGTRSAGFRASEQCHGSVLWTVCLFLFVGAKLVPSRFTEKEKKYSRNDFPVRSWFPYDHGRRLPKWRKKIKSDGMKLWEMRKLIYACKLWIVGSVNKQIL